MGRMESQPKILREVSEISNDEVTLNEYRALATKIRAQALRMVHNGHISHIGSNLSIADIIATLYGGILRIDARRPDWPGRDRFILSKGHACAVVYAVLAECGFFPMKWLDTFYQNGSLLFGHITHHGIPGVEASTGSLGHGLSIGCGIALAGKRDEQTYRTYVLLSDGECDEGSTWEAVLLASHHQLDNLVAIVDYNNLQGYGRARELCAFEPFVDKWRSFGWHDTEVDGHSEAALDAAFATQTSGKPKVIIAHTVKGKGVSFMENQLKWHYFIVTEQHKQQALDELQ